MQIARNSHPQPPESTRSASAPKPIPSVLTGQRPEQGNGGRSDESPKDASSWSQCAFDHAPIGMALVDIGGCFLEVNAALCRITGYSRDELMATNFRALTHSEDIDLEDQPARDLLSGRVASYALEKRYRHHQGHYVWMLVTVALVRDEQGQPSHAIWQVQNISERKEREDQLAYLVDHDYLTGLFNRRRFEQELVKEAHRTARYGFSSALILADLDHFKDVNDALGHETGDELLQAVAETLRHRIRQTDVLARVGGDEFAVLLPQTGTDQALTVAENIVESLRQRVVVDGERSIRVTASVGVTLFEGLNAAELMPHADLAMYEAKAAGRDRIAMYPPASDRKTKEPVRVTRRLAAPGRAGLREAERIRGALAADAVLLYGQPVLDLEDNQVRRYELVLRLPGKRRGNLLSPPYLVDKAEGNRLGSAIACWAIRKAIATIAEYERAERMLVLHARLSGATLNPEVTRVIETALIQSGIDPASLVLELTDTKAIASLEQVRTCTQRLRAYGCQLVLDDFPNGCGSFYYVKNLPFDYVKIDGDFIRGIAENLEDRVVVEAIVDIARGLGKKTIAERVADDATASVLRQSGVDHALGDYVGQASLLTEVLAQSSSASDSVK
ncbi:MAG TPA: EAL domain-containing protein [Vicinamibacteria bacterium]|nr:EAL domain-containing protein [Vicinamibacteria bacterium]